MEEFMFAGPSSHSKIKPIRRFAAMLPVLLGILGMTLACSGGAAVEPPGQGAKAELGYQACAPIIAALGRYHDANGAYPQTLAELVPDYLPSVPGVVNDQPIQYSRTDESYSLSFGYVGPGLNTCTYSPDQEQGWRCSGLY
jgi:hypothetical protein